jgi:hypothetical protein
MSFEIDKLYLQMDRKFIEIAMLLAEQLGYPPGDERAKEEADAVIERWGENVETAEIGTEPMTPLQQLLMEYYDIVENILARFCFEPMTRELAVAA